MRKEFRLFLAAILMSLSSLAAQAWDEDYIPPDYGSPDPYVRYVSWCNRDKIIVEDYKGIGVVAQDCSKELINRRCVEESVRKGQVDWISAICTH